MMNMVSASGLQLHLRWGALEAIPGPPGIPDSLHRLPLEKKQCEARQNAVLESGLLLVTTRGWGACP
eukprot:667793-Pelagomonas_calceolata.AAC.4